VAEVYKKLLEIVKDKDYFVITSNVDTMFVKTGFDPNKIYTPQGDFRYMQCHVPCQPEVWESNPMIEEGLKFMDLETLQITNSAAIPHCKFCGGAAVPNVRGGDYFLHEPYEEQEARMNAWIQKTKDEGKKLVMLEVGAGFNTPGVIRFRLERLTFFHPTAKMIRINMEDAELAPPIMKAGKGIELQANASHAYNMLLKNLRKE